MTATSLFDQRVASWAPQKRMAVAKKIEAAADRIRDGLWCRGRYTAILPTGVHHCAEGHLAIACGVAAASQDGENQLDASRVLGDVISDETGGAFCALARFNDSQTDKRKVVRLFERTVDKLRG